MDVQTERWTERKRTDKNDYTIRQTDRKLVVHMYTVQKQADKPNIKTVHTDKQKYRQTYRQQNGQKRDESTDGQMNAQTDRLT